MGMFSRETDSGKLNVHEMQTMWFEHHCGNAHYRKGELREALKQFNFIAVHLTTMADDCDEFQHFAHRRGMINHIDQMLEFAGNVHVGRWPVRSCIGTLRVLSKLAKAAANPEQMEAWNKEHEAYLNSEEF